MVQPNRRRSGRLQHPNHHPDSLRSNNLTNMLASDIEPLTHIHHNRTRLSNALSYFIPSIHTNLGKAMISYIGQRVWNEVSQEIKLLPKNKFKKVY